MSRPKTADLEALLTALCDARVDFIVVGGAAAVLHGAPITTQDLDIVHRRTPDNVARLLGVLTELDAMFRPVLPGRQIRPTAEMLSGRGQLNLSTNLGPLDALCELHEGGGYDELIAHTEEVADGSLVLCVLDLPTLIAIKAATGRAKDKLAVPILLALQRERDGMGITAALNFVLYGVIFSQTLHGEAERIAPQLARGCEPELLADIIAAIRAELAHPTGRIRDLCPILASDETRVSETDLRTFLHEVADRVQKRT